MEKTAQSSISKFKNQNIFFNFTNKLPQFIVIFLLYLNRNQKYLASFFFVCLHV